MLVYISKLQLSNNIEILAKSHIGDVVMQSHTLGDKFIDRSLQFSTLGLGYMGMSEVYGAADETEEIEAT